MYRKGNLIFTLLEKRMAPDEVIHFLKQMLTHQELKGNVSGNCILRGSLKSE